MNVHVNEICKMFSMFFIREVVPEEATPMHDRETRVLADLVTSEQKLLVAQGG